MLVCPTNFVIQVVVSAKRDGTISQSATIRVQRGATHAQLARTAYPLKAIEAAKSMSRAITPLAPSSSASAVTRSPQHAVATGDICPSRILLRSSGLHRGTRSLHRPKPAHELDAW